MSAAVLPPLPNDSEKFRTVLERNTFFFHDAQFQEDHESLITSFTNLLLILKNQLDVVRANDERKAIVASFITDHPDGLRAVLALLGLSNESLLRMITFTRVVNDPALRTLVRYDAWGLTDETFRSEWRTDKILKRIMDNKDFAAGLVNLFFEGTTIPVLRNAVPLFEFKKLSFMKLDFSTETLIDTIIRYNAKGAYAAAGKNNASGLIRKLLEQADIPFQENPRVLNIRRDMDFAIPDKQQPRIIVESSYVVTTASEMGDKAKTELEVANDIKQYYPNTRFVGFVDGIGWYVRQSDLKRMVHAFDEVFTFQEQELERFIAYIHSYYMKRHAFKNHIIRGDALEVLRQIPTESVDMAFADPPFNLNKKYGNYKDDRNMVDYLKWCYLVARRNGARRQTNRLHPRS